MSVEVCSEFCRLGQAPRSPGNEREMPGLRTACPSLRRLPTIQIGQLLIEQS